MRVKIDLKKQRYGKKCRGCKRIGDVILAQLWHDDKNVWSAQLCHSCLEKGVVAETTIKSRNDNPLAKREAKRRIKKSRELEQSLAKRVGGRAQPASGGTRLSGFKGDIRKVGEWRIEHKFTEALKEWTLRLSELAKIINLAMEANEYPALVVEFVKAKASFAIIPLALFLEMVNEDEDDS